MTPAQMMERIAFLEGENEALRAQVEWFRRAWLGTGKSETQDALQTRLDIDTPQEDVPEKKQKISYERLVKKSRRELPAARFEKLPGTETVELLPDEVKADPGLCERIGEESTFS